MPLTRRKGVELRGRGKRRQFCYLGSGDGKSWFLLRKHYIIRELCGSYINCDGSEERASGESWKNCEEMVPRFWIPCHSLDKTLKVYLVRCYDICPLLTLWDMTQKRKYSLLFLNGWSGMEFRRVTSGNLFSEGRSLSFSLNAASPPIRMAITYEGVAYKFGPNIMLFRVLIHST